MAGGSCVLRWLKTPVSVEPSASLLSLIVTGEEVFQSVPRSVTGLPPSEVTRPPRMAEDVVTVADVGEVTAGGSSKAEVAWLRGLFIACMVSLSGSLVAFIRDINLSLGALKLELGDQQVV